MLKWMNKKWMSRCSIHKSVKKKMHSYVCMSPSKKFDISSTMASLDVEALDLTYDILSVLILKEYCNLYFDSAV